MKKEKKTEMDFFTNKNLFPFFWIWHHIIVVSENVKVINFNSMAIKYI